ncbi:helix-turn-helix transcriptional regulator [Escherichia coli]|uniref:helix-turn-helix transcriptional regulator n=1 Tax=Escherichia coli TaxID=562 RepID=UPI002075CA0D|nr:Rha family transcriptional regulator [Escherichia coli]
MICSPMTSLKTSIKTITYLSDIGCLEIQGASLAPIKLGRSSRWLKSEVEAWLQARIAQSRP